MAYNRRNVTDGNTIMNADLYNNLQDGIDTSLEHIRDTSIHVYRDEIGLYVNIDEPLDEPPIEVVLSNLELADENSTTIINSDGIDYDGKDIEDGKYYYDII